MSFYSIFAKAYMYSKIIFTSHFSVLEPFHDYLDLRKYRSGQFKLGRTGLPQSRAWRFWPTLTKQNPRSGSRSGLIRGEGGHKNHRAKLTMSWDSSRDVGSCLKECLCKNAGVVWRGEKGLNYLNWFCSGSKNKIEIVSNNPYIHNQLKLKKR